MTQFLACPLVAPLSFPTTANRLVISHLPPQLLCHQLLTQTVHPLLFAESLICYVAIVFLSTLLTSLFN